MSRRRLSVAHEVVHHVRDAQRQSEQVHQGGREEEPSQPPHADEPRAEDLLFTPRNGIDETRRGICLVSQLSVFSIYRHINRASRHVLTGSRMASRGNGLVAPSNMPVSIMPGQMVVVQTELSQVSITTAHPLQTARVLVGPAPG